MTPPKVPLEFVAALLGIAIIMGGVAVWKTWPRTETAPDFAVKTLDNETFELSQERGHVVVLDFFATWCASCEITAKALREALPAWNQTEVRVLAVDVDASESDHDLQAYRERNNITWNMTRDTDGVANRYAVYALGRVTVVNPDGKIAWDKTGTVTTTEFLQAVTQAQTAAGTTVGIPRAGILALGALAGAATFFSPCAVALLPAYVTATARPASPEEPTGARWRRQSRVGLASASGLVLTYLGLGSLVLLLGAVVRPYVPYLLLVSGILLLVFGVLTMLNPAWMMRWARFPVLQPGLVTLEESPTATRRHFAYGLGYAGAASACTTPVLLQVATTAIAAGPLMGAGLVVAYALTAGVMMVLVTWAALFVPVASLQRLVRGGRALPLLTGLVFAGAGLYVVYYYWRAFG